MAKDKLFNKGVPPEPPEPELPEGEMPEESIFDKIRENIQGQAVAIVKKQQGELSSVDLECGTFVFTSEVEFRNSLDNLAKRYGGGLYKVFIKTMQGKWPAGIARPMMFNYADSVVKENSTTLQPPNITVTTPEGKPAGDNNNFLMTMLQLEREKADKFLQVMLQNQVENSKNIVNIQQMNAQQIQAMQTSMQTFMSNIQSLIVSSKEKEVREDAVDTLIKLKSAGLLPENKGLSGDDIKGLINTGIDLASMGAGGAGKDKGIMGDISEIVKTAVDLLKMRNQVVQPAIQGRQVQKVETQKIQPQEVKLGEEGVKKETKPELKNEVEEIVFKNSTALETFSNYNVAIPNVVDTILKQVPEAYDTKLLDWLKTEPNRVYEILPFLSNNKEWTEKLKEELIKVLSEPVVVDSEIPDADKKDTDE